MEVLLVAVDGAEVRPVVDVDGELVDVETGAPVDLERVVLRAVTVGGAVAA